MSSRKRHDGRDSERDIGRDADAPHQVPPRGWKDVLLRTKREIKKDRISMVAAAMAFYATLALFPGLIALVSIYALLNDPAEVQRQLASFTGMLPTEARDLVTEYLRSASERAGAALGWGAALGIIGALWSASGGTLSLIKAINIAYDEQETRGYVALRGLALTLTCAFIVAVVVAFALVAVLPAVLDRFGLGEALRALIAVGRWPVLALGMILVLALLYRYSPDRNRARMRWVSWGSTVATAGWIGASLLFSLYVSQFGKFGQTYGPLSGVIVLMLWLFVTSFLVLLGAELNAELEAQTAKDSTVGPPAPMGQREARKADELGEHVADAR